MAKNNHIQQYSCANCNESNCLLNLYCDDEWRIILDAHKSIFHFPKNTRIISEGQLIQGIYIIQSGKVKVLKKMGQNAERIIRLSSNGDFVGHRGLGAEHYPISAVALTDVSLAFIPSEVFINILKANHRLLFHMMLFFANELKTSEEHLKKLVELPVKSKIAYAINLCAEAFGFREDSPKTLSFSLSRKELSNIAATTYETTIRMLKELEKEQTIQLSPKEIKILNIQQLEEYTKTN